MGLFCEGCGSTFTVAPLRAGKARFCTLECWNLWQKTHPVTGERIQRITKACRACGKDMIQRPRDRIIFCSDKCHRAWRRKSMATKGTAYSRARRGKRADLGETFFRSSWEANYARYLNFLRDKGLILKWEYEPETFWFEKIRRGVRSYTPDFRVTANGRSYYYVELKGWMDARSKTKIKRMAKYYPKVDLRVVGAKDYKDIVAKLGSVIPNWEAA